MSAIQFDKNDIEYYRTQLIQMKLTYSLLLEIKEKGILEVQKTTLDAYHDATYAMLSATVKFECKRDCGPTMLMLCCEWNNYCCGCCICYRLDVTRRRGKFIRDRDDIKTFLTDQELRARAFSVEQLNQMRSRAMAAAESNNYGNMLKEAEALDLLERQLSSSGMAMQMLPPSMNLAGMPFATAGMPVHPMQMSMAYR
jgi:hypothetical protein